jgi:hypothetical protein
MRKKAAESERAPGGTATDDADDGEDDAPRRDDGDGDGDGKSTSPDDALDALNRFIEDLRLPGET